MTAEDLRNARMTTQLGELMKYEVGRARELLMSGRTLSRMVDRRLGRDVLMFAGGGLAILRAIEHVGYDVFRSRPRLTRLDYVKLGWRALAGRLEI